MDEELAKWVEEKEAKWKAEEPARLLKQAQLNRDLAYPSLADQLDMLWRAIDSGKDLKDSDFYKTLKAVRDKYPMPSDTNLGVIDAVN